MSNIHSIDRGVWALALATKDGMQREVARRRLVALGREATPVLIQLLDDSEPKVRWEAALALKELGDPASVEALVEALKDENSDVRWVAAEGLAVIGEESLRPLLETLRQEADSFELRDSAHVAISLLEDGELRELLAPVYQAMKDGKSPEVVIMAAAEALEALESRDHPVD
jgi:HEAT repeat protein